MAIGYVLFNPKAGNGEYNKNITVLEMVTDDRLVYQDMTSITNYRAYLQNLQPEDYIILAGGDGTLNRFINDTVGIEFPNEIYCYPIGTGNDFAKDLGYSAGCNPFPITHYLQDLPTVEVGGRRWRFLNGVGFGVDGYCCEEGDRLRAQGKKKVNYTAIAIRGLLLSFKPRNAVVTVDGVRHEFHKVWIAPTMHGRLYGGGMIPTPNQKRLSDDPKLSLMVMHSTGKLRTLMIFPSIFNGAHIAHKEAVTVLEGREITVEFDRPTPLQIDGETVSGVTGYTATAAKLPAKV